MEASRVLHEGELAVQGRVGVREEVADLAARMLSPRLSDQIRAFFPTLPFVVAAARDARGRPWVTLLAGNPGFALAPDAAALRLGARPVPGDALEHAFVAGAPIGLLGIELETRRRNRVNGTVARTDDGGDGEDGEDDVIALAVDQAFGNCPQYISTRAREPAPFDPASVRVERHVRLDGRARAAIAAADTLFVGTGHEGTGIGAGMDASHRGGVPGFVEVVDESRLVLPDYAGNRLFNTLGNLELDPRIGLSFVDFDRGGLLQLTGRARVEWLPAASSRHPGAQRLVHVSVDAVVRLERALPWHWRGTAAARRELVVVDRSRAGNDVVALTFEPRDGGVIAFEAGQYLPLELPGGAARGLVRTYSLAGDPAAAAEPEAPRVRIGVRRESRGIVSGALHELGVGDIVLAGAPAGDFALPPGSGPAALAGAGVGITPIVAMVHRLARTGREARVVQVAKDGRNAPFSEELRELARTCPTLHLLTVFTRPGDEDRPGIDHDVSGRPDAALVATWLGGDVDIDVRLCGPPGFLASMAGLLEGAGVPDERIVSEGF